MFFIITALAAIVTIVIWYVNAPNDKYNLSTLCFIYWGATLMWLADHVMTYLAEGGEFFEITLNATLLGITAVSFGLVVWIVMLAVNDSKVIFNKLLQLKK